MKKLISLLLCLALLAGLPAGAAFAADSEETQEPEKETNLAAETGAQTIAVTLAAWLMGYPDTAELDDPLLLWDAAGWYAAWLYRTEGCDLMTWEGTEDFLRSVGYEGECVLPENWEEYGVVRLLRDRESREYLDFSQHKLELDDMLGTNTMVTTVESGENTVTSVLSCFYEYGLTAEWMYSLSFEKNGEGSAFPYRLTDVELLDDGPRMDAELDFTWDELLEANRLENILASCPAVRFYDGNGEMGDTWLLSVGGDIVRVSVGEYTTGAIRGCYFDYEETEDGAQRARIGYVDEEESEHFLDDYLTNYLTGVSIVGKEKTEGDPLWLRCTYSSGYQEMIAVDRETLVLREMDYYYDAELPPSATCVDYTEDAPDFPFLKGWEGELRTVTAHWEDYRWVWDVNGYEADTWTTAVQIPADWEYLPNDARWGEFTAYSDEGYTESYAYPGDGVDYTLYLTTAKG